MSARHHVVAALAVTGLLPALGSCAAKRDASGASPALAPALAHESGDLDVHGLADYTWLVRPLDRAAAPSTLEHLRGRVLFINVWATWCLPCVAELASIAALRDSLRASDVVFLIVSPEEPARVEAFLRRHRYDLPVYVEERAMPAAYGLEALPTTFVVDRSGRIVLRHRGAAHWDAAPVRRFLRHLDGRPAQRAAASGQEGPPR